MHLPQAIIEKLNQGLGIDGQPYQINDVNGWVDTGCYKWTKSLNYIDVMRTMPPSLAEAFNRLSAIPVQDHQQDFQKRTDDFFSQETTETQAEYASFMARLHEAQEAYILTPPKLTYSPQLQEAMDRLQEQLSHEDFTRNDTFDLKSYTVRLQKFYSMEPPEIQAEVQAITEQSMAYHRQYKQQIRRKKLALTEVRALLQDDPVVAYRAGIEWDGMPSSGYETIVVAPTSDQWDILRIEHTQGNNYTISTEDLITILKEIDAAYGVDITGASLDGVEFTLKRIPKGKEAQELGQRLFAICPDLGEAPHKFPRGRVSLWWD